MKRFGKPKGHRLNHWSQYDCMPQHLLSSSFSMIMLWQLGSLQTKTQYTQALKQSLCMQKASTKSDVAKACHDDISLFLEEFWSQEMGKEASLPDLRAWRNHLLALSCPLIPTKCHSAYICKKTIAIFNETIFQKKRKYHSIYDSQHQGKICEKGSSEVFNLPG